jgi:hypothetical protein
MSPFAGFKDFAACVAANKDKKDPEAYCAQIMRMVEGASSKAKSAPKRKDSAR